jgi:hypothetical protein
MQLPASKRRSGRKNMREYLERFSKRMELVAVVDSIVGRKNRKLETESQFSDGELDNILMSILVFIMETTLTEEQDCTLGAITDFLASILPSYGKQASIAECEDFARYLIKDILQNKGEMRSNPIMDYSAGMRDFPVRLVADKLGNNNEILYELTKQGFDFLFRTKEVDDELGFEIEAIRLKLLIIKKNYKKAMSQSKYILAMIMEKRNELRQFEQQMNHDLFSVSGEQYNELVRTVNMMLHEEYEVMKEISNMLKQAQEHLDEENRRNSSLDEKSRLAQQDIYYISQNVERALGMQWELLVKCSEIDKLYRSLLVNSLEFHQMKRFDIEEQILRPMEQFSFKEAAQINKVRAELLSPLFFPDIKRTLNLALVYERQGKIKEIDIAGIMDEDETMDDSAKAERIKWRNDAHVMVIRLLLEYARNHASFSFHDFWEHSKNNSHIEKMTAERILFLDFLKLYEIREIDFARWREEDTHSLDCMGEFDLDYCLSKCLEIDKAWLEIRSILIDKAKEGQRIFCEISANEHIYISDFIIEVQYNERSSENIGQAIS